MHEQSLMNSLMRQIGTVAAKENATRVISVKVRLGALSHMSSDHFREHFDEAARGGIAEKANLEIELSSDESDPNAMEIMIESVEVLQET